MSIINELENLASLLPIKQEVSVLSQSLQQAIDNSDGNLIKSILSENKLNADMTRVTIFENLFE